MSDAAMKVNGYVVGVIMIAIGFGCAVLVNHLRQGEPDNSPQALLHGTAAKPVVAVNRLSGITTTAARAIEVVSANPLEQLNDHPGRAAALSEMGEFASSDPVFTLTISAPNIDIALDSLKRIYAELPERDAQALDFAVRFLAVTRLKGSDFTAFGEDPTSIPDAALFKHILPVIDGRTPMQVIVDARQEQERLKKAREEIPVDPFDRIEMERRGQPPGMSIPR